MLVYVHYNSQNIIMKRILKKYNFLLFKLSVWLHFVYGVCVCMRGRTERVPYAAYNSYSAIRDCECVCVSVWQPRRVFAFRFVRITGTPRMCARRLPYNTCVQSKPVNIVKFVVYAAKKIFVLYAIMFQIPIDRRVIHTRNSSAERQKFIIMK